MCRAFSCIVDQQARVAWKLGVDSHTDILEMTCTFPWLSQCKDNTADPSQMTFARVEITPDNGNYLEPNVWTVKVDQTITPIWFAEKHRVAAQKAHAKWLTKLDAILRKEILHPFKITPPSKITKKHINMLRQWDSVGDSVRDSVRDSVWDSVRDSVGDSVWDSVWKSVWKSVGDSVWDSVWKSVWAYAGSFFQLKEWKYVKYPKGRYPFGSCVSLWKVGLVPSFDGKTWRLHGGPKAEILFEISAKELRGKR